ncbi:Stp1/IreP family PP2C-type Ser/Thr phosphatase [Nibrella viscosa]|uniref:Stp1/IreP family PP2C-type Ser/Thr phosphatase n=1 Tax=Nibrella viscosa TaxID=1084524 RepID=A0ABP8KX97_9BACT
MKGLWQRWTRRGNTPDSPAPWEVRAVVRTDIGKRRSHNEDAAAFVRPGTASVRTEKGCLAIVADGMGGHLAGEVASQMALETLREVYFQQNTSPEQALKTAFTEANRRIWQAAQEQTDQRGMGTTCTVALVRGTSLYMGHIGDSRLYHIGINGILRQLTRDDTLVQALVTEGVLTPDEALTHPDRNLLTHALGMEPDLSPHVEQWAEPLQTGDRLLLCSDGLYDLLDPAELTTELLNPSIHEAADRLLNLALDRGGHDNVTLLILEINPSAVLSADTATPSYDAQ